MTDFEELPSLPQQLPDPATPDSLALPPPPVPGTLPLEDSPWNAEDDIEAMTAADTDALGVSDIWPTVKALPYFFRQGVKASIGTTGSALGAPAALDQESVNTGQNVLGVLEGYEFQTPESELMTPPGYMPALQQAGKALSEAAKSGMQQRREEITAQTGEPLSATSEGLLSGAASLGTSLMGLGLGVLTRSYFAAPILVNHFAEYGEAIEDAIDRKIPLENQQRYAAINAAIADAGEVAPFLLLGKYIEGRVGKGLGALLLKLGGLDITGELATTVGQKVNAWAHTHPEQAFYEAFSDPRFTRELPRELQITAIASAFQSGLMGGSAALLRPGKDTLWESPGDRAFRRWRSAVDKLEQLGADPEIGQLDPEGAANERSRLDDAQWARARTAPVTHTTAEDLTLVGKSLDTALREGRVAVTGFEAVPELNASDAVARRYTLAAETLRREAAAFVQKMIDVTGSQDAAFVLEDTNLQARIVEGEPHLGIPRRDSTLGKYYYHDPATSQRVEVLQLNPADVWRAFDPQTPAKERRRLRDLMRQTLAHEFSHSLAVRYYDTAAPVVRKALYAEWKALTDRLRSGELTMQQYGKKAFSQDRYRTVMAALEKVGVSPHTRGDVALRALERRSHDNKRLTDYLLSFQEWMGEQGARAQYSRQGLSAPLDTFWQKLHHALKQIWNIASLRYSRYAPMPTYRHFLQSVRSSNRLTRALNDSLEATPKYEAPDTPQTFAARIARVGRKFAPEAMANIGATQQSMAQDSERFSALVKYGYTLLQIARKYEHVQPLQEYVELIRDFTAMSKLWEKRAIGRVTEVSLLGRDADAVFKLLAAESAQGAFLLPGSPGWTRLFGKGFKLSQAQEKLYLDIKADFLDMLKAWERLAIAEAHTQLQADPAKLAVKLADIKKQFGALASKPYFPQSRFGKFYTVVVEKHGGKTLWREHTYTRSQQKALEKQLRKLYPQEIVSSGTMEDGAEVFYGIPPQFLENVQNRLGLTSDQFEKLQELKLEMLPGQSARKHFMRKENIGGWSEDGLRQYANYFFFTPIALAKATYRPRLHRKVREVAATIKERRMQGLNTEARERLTAWLDRHLEYVMHPGNEGVFLRQLGFLHYLGFNLKSAVVNLTQTQLATYPHLAALYGDRAAVGEIARAYKDILTKYRSYTKTTAGQARQLEYIELQSAIDMGRLRGSLDESLAATLAGLAEAGNIERMLPGTRAGQAWHSFNYYAAYMFQAAEGLNREVTFVAAYRLGRKNGMSPQQAVEHAIEAVDATQGEYARWNRPTIFRNKGSVIFLFKMYTQLMLHFMLGGNAGWWRAWLMMFLYGGVLGLPFLENLTDLGDAAIQMLGKPANVRAELKKFIGETLERTGINDASDYFMHGLSRNAFGLGLDISGSLSLGRVIPGTGLLRSWRSSDRPESSVLYAEREALGPVLGYPLLLMNTALSNDPNTIRKWRTLAGTAASNILDAYEIARHGGVTDATNAFVWRFDPAEARKVIALAGHAAGFPIAEVNRRREELRLIAENVGYWSQRRSDLMRQFNYARDFRNREGMADVTRRIHEFHRNKPHMIPGIGDKDMERSVRQSATSDILKERYGVPSARDVPYARSLLSGRKPSALSGELPPPASGLPPP
jgi:hypothetical protein